MKINCKLKIEKIVAKDGVRYCLKDPHLDAKNKCLVATDGHKLVKIPVEVHPDDTTGHVPLAAIQDARRMKLADAEILCNGNVTLQSPDGATAVSYERHDPDDWKFPDYDRVMPDTSQAPTMRIGLNARYLLELANALAVNGRGKEPILVLDIYDALSAVRVRSLSDVKDPCAAEGVVMPVRCD